MTNISIPLYRKPSFRFGIKHSILAFRRRGVTFFVYIDLLLRFLDKKSCLNNININILQSSIVSTPISTLIIVALFSSTFFQVHLLL